MLGTYLVVGAVLTTWPWRLRARRLWRVIHLGSVAGFGVPLALSVHVRHRDEALLTLSEEAATAAAQLRTPLASLRLRLESEGPGGEGTGGPAGTGAPARRSRRSAPRARRPRTGRGAPPRARRARPGAPLPRHHDTGGGAVHTVIRSLLIGIDALGALWAALSALATSWPVDASDSLTSRAPTHGLVGP